MDISERTFRDNDLFLSQDGVREKYRIMTKTMTLYIFGTWRIGRILDSFDAASALLDGVIRLV